MQKEKEPMTCMSILFYTLFGLLLLHVVLYLCVFVFFISDVRKKENRKHTIVCQCVDPCLYRPRSISVVSVFSEFLEPHHHLQHAIGQGQGGVPARWACNGKALVFCEQVNVRLHGCGCADLWARGRVVGSVGASGWQVCTCVWHRIWSAVCPSWSPLQ